MFYLFSSILFKLFRLIGHTFSRDFKLLTIVMSKILSIITIILLVNSTSLFNCQQVQDPDIFCANKRHNARFGDDADPPNESLTCRNSYIYCFHDGTAMIGERYMCVGSTYFNPARGVCLRNAACVTIIVEQ